MAIADPAVMAEFDRLRDVGGQLDVGEVSHQVARAGEVLLCGVDQHRIQVDADDGVATLVQVAGVATRTTSGVQDGRTPRGQGIDQACFADQVGAGCGHVAEPLHVPGRMVGVGGGRVRPLAARSAGDAPRRAERVDRAELRGIHEPPTGFEPATVRLQGGCSTN